MMARRVDRAILLGRGARKSASDWQEVRTREDRDYRGVIETSLDFRHCEL